MANIFGKLLFARAGFLRSVLIGLLSAFVAYAAASNSIINATKRKNADIALWLDPYNTVALTLNADLRFLASQDAKSLIEVDAAVTRALTAQPINATALRLKGYVADVQGDNAAAARWMNTSVKLSRRDFGTQLWLIESAVEKGDTKATLRHYDLALRTNYDVRAILFPTLVDALARRDVRMELAPYVAAAPPWIPDFLHAAISGSKDLADVVDLIKISGGLPASMAVGSLPDYLLSQLVAQRKFAAAFQYYSLLPEARVASLKSTSFKEQFSNIRYPTAGWQLFEGTSTGGSFVKVEHVTTRVLQVFAESGQRNIITRKLLYLGFGDYRINIAHTARDSASNAEVTWDVQCLNNNGANSLWSKTADVVQGQFVMTGSFRINEKCEAQMINLNVAAGSGQTGVEFTVDRVDVSPM